MCSNLGGLPFDVPPASLRRSCDLICNFSMKKESIGEPPERLEPNEVVAKVLQNRGSTFDISVPESQLPKVKEVLGSEAAELLVGLSPALRHKFFIKRNGFVIVTLEKIGNGKISGEITNVVDDTRYWQRNFADWPIEYGVPQETSTLDLPPISDEDEYEYEEYSEEEQASAQ